MRKRKAKRNMVGISMLAVMGITLLTPGVGMNEVKAAVYVPVTIDETTFPDSVFREWVKNNCDDNNDGILSVDERLQCTQISVENAGIASLEGIEYFHDLTLLNCGRNSLTSLNVSENTALTALYCHENNLSTLDVSNNPALTDLYCSENNLSTLNVSYNTALTDLVCHNNNLSSLDVSHNPALEMLHCNNNNISSLDVSHNPALDALDCSYNNLSSLDVSHNPLLGHFVCSNNKLSSLDVSNNPAIHRLYCRYNNLTSLDVSKNTNLAQLQVEGNSLCSLDLSKNTKLIEFEDLQNVWVPMYKNGDEYYIDLSGLLLDRERLSMTEYWMKENGATYDSTTGRINLSETKDVGYTVWYEYETNGPASLSNTKMDVGLRISDVRDITEPTTEEPTTEEPTTEEPSMEEPTTEEPGTEEPTTEAPTTEAPTTEAPTTETPTTEAPATTQNTPSNNVPSPKTGDDAPVYPILLFMLVSAGAGLTLYIHKKRKQ